MSNHNKSIQLARKVWARLIVLAEEHSTITYQDLGEAYGIRGQALQGFHSILAPIKYYCIKHGLPPLNALVVRKDSNLPGSGAEADENDISNVFTYTWRNRTPVIPSEEDLAAALNESS